MIAKYREQFIEGSGKLGLGKKDAEEIFSLIEKFAGYGFNKSHSTAYALIAYMTAYLKAHWPVEFMAALLTSDISGRNFKKKDSLVEHLEDCTRMNVTVEPPNVNASLEEFSVADGKIRFGLSAIKGCGGAAAGSIVAQRSAGGPYKSIFDFCERLDPSMVNRTAIESLIKAGRVRFDRRTPFGGLRRRRSGAAIGRVGRFRPQERPTRAVRRSRGAGRSRYRLAPRSARVGGEGQTRQGKRGLGLLSVKSSAGRARPNAQGVLLAHDRRGGGARASHRSRCWAA